MPAAPWEEMPGIVARARMRATSGMVPRNAPMYRAVDMPAWPSPSADAMTTPRTAPGNVPCVTDSAKKIRLSR